MARRALLHRNKLDAFLSHMEFLGADIEQPKGDWQVARFRFKGESPHIIYENLRSEHLSLENKTVPLFEKWHDFYYFKGVEDGR